MIQFKIYSDYLELPADFNLQIKRKNNIFAFGNLELSRTASFTIPATAKNDLLLGFARNERMTASVMRQRVSAVMVYSGGSVSGYIYISSADANGYSATFVFGELLKFKELKEAGNIGDYLTGLQDSVLWEDGSEIDTSTARKFYAMYRYDRPTSDVPYLPAIRLYNLMTRAAAALGISFPVDTFWLNLPYVIVPNKLEGGGIDGTQTMKKTNASTIVPTRLNLDWWSTADTSTAEKRKYQKDYNMGVVFENEVMSSIVMRWYEAKRDMTITFPSDIPDTCVLLQSVDTNYSLRSGTFTPQTFGLRSVRFIGDPDDGSQCTYDLSGTPLAGSIMAVPSGTKFAIVDVRNFWFRYYESGTIFYKEIGWVGDGSPYEYNLQVDLESDGTIGSYIYLQNNLPEVTLMDLIKTVAMVSGKVPSWSESNAQVSFKSVDVDSWSVKELQDIIAVKNVRRTFSDYAQANSVQYDSEEYVTERGENIVRTYEIDNVNLQDEKDLYKIPFSEGAIGANGIYIEGTSLNDSGEVVYAGKKWSLARVLIYGTNYLQRAPITENAAISSLCNKSTRLQVQVPMYMFEAFGLSEQTRLLFNGLYYVWTEITYSKGVATIELSRC